MTNQTLERAARAVSETMASVPAKAMNNTEWIDFERKIARAVLMAVLPDEVDADGAPDWMDPAQAYGWGCGFNACRQAIMNDGEEE